VTALNSVGVTAASGSTVLYSFIEGQYRIINVLHVSRDMADDLRFVSPNYQLHEVPVAILVAPPVTLDSAGDPDGGCDDEEWVTKIVGVEC
jgi:hypothetical protein